jgi:hypothetical protein
MITSEKIEHYVKKKSNFEKIESKGGFSFKTDIGIGKTGNFLNRMQSTSYSIAGIVTNIEHHSITLLRIRINNTDQTLPSKHKKLSGACFNIWHG